MADVITSDFSLSTVYRAATLHARTHTYSGWVSACHSEPEDAKTEDARVVCSLGGFATAGKGEDRLADLEI